MPDRIDKAVTKLVPMFEQIQQAIVKISLNIIKQEPTLQEIADFPMAEFVYRDLAGYEIAQTVANVSGKIAMSKNPNVTVAIGRLDEQFFINELGKAAANAKRVIANAFQYNYTPHKLKELLQAELVNLSESKIGALLNTAIRTTEATAYAELIADLPAETVCDYVGPEDDRNRPFCAKWVNKKITLGELQELLNDDGEPAITARGGYNCRHNWEQVFE